MDAPRLDPQTVEITTDGYWLFYKLHGEVVDDFLATAAFAGNIHSAKSGSRIGRKDTYHIQTYPWMFAGTLADKCAFEDGVYVGSDYRVPLADGVMIDNSHKYEGAGGVERTLHQIVEMQPA